MVRLNFHKDMVFLENKTSKKLKYSSDFFLSYTVTQKNISSTLEKFLIVMYLYKN